MKIKTVRSFDPANPTQMVVEWHGGDVETYDFDNVPEHILAQLAWHGFKQKTMDAHSGTYKETGSVDACRAVSEEVISRLAAGDWGAERSSAPWVVEAISDLFDLDYDEALETYQGLTEEQRKAIPKDPKVKAWKAERDLAKAKAQADSGESQVGNLFAAK